MVTPADLGLSAQSFIEYALSLNGRWVAIALVRAGQPLRGPEDPKRALCLAAGEDLQAGWLGEGVWLVGRNAEPPAALLEDLRARELWALRLSPSQGTQGVLPSC
ncbi:MAG: hypothetical protein NZM16_07510 [Thermoflexus sp.]|nr:hypothetical protein [Thermoflexus sp.]MCS6963877.1 hypothetical protein [Thermoflexus sp.]MDW8186037.1 hypothetical protein [Anaerolineae bacterium]